MYPVDYTLDFDLYLSLEFTSDEGGGRVLMEKLSHRQASWYMYS